MSNSNNGWVKIHRSLINWEWFDCSSTVHLFLYLLLAANHKDLQWKGRTIKRGQVLTSRAKISANTGLSDRQIRTSLERLKATNEVTIKATNLNSIITVCKYDSYQENKNTSDQQNDQQNDQQRTNQQTRMKRNIRNIGDDFENENGLEKFDACIIKMRNNPEAGWKATMLKYFEQGRGNVYGYSDQKELDEFDRIYRIVKNRINAADPETLRGKNYKQINQIILQVAKQGFNQLRYDDFLKTKKLKNVADQFNSLLDKANKKYNAHG